MTVRTVGVEEELLLVGTQGEVLPLGEQAAATAELVEHEFKLEQAEIASDPCLNADDIRSQLLERRHLMDQSVHDIGGRAVAIATSPLSARPHSTPDERYQRMAREFGLVGAQQLTCGQHVHVGIESPAEGVAVLDRIRGWLPLLRAVSGNSPFSHGQDTGYASYRTVLWGQWPTSGPVDLFGDETGYDRAVAEAIASGAALDEGMIYFDARLSAHYPTVEIRVADVCTDVEDSVLIAVLCRALVDTAAMSARVGSPPESRTVGLLRAANWRAARYGLHGELVDARPGGKTVSLREAWALLDDLVTEIAPALDRAGDSDLVADGLRRLRSLGGGADRQRACWAETADLRAVVRDAADRTLAG